MVVYQSAKVAAMIETKTEILVYYEEHTSSAVKEFVNTDLKLKEQPFSASLVLTR